MSNPKETNFFDHGVAHSYRNGLACHCGRTEADAREMSNSYCLIERTAARSGSLQLLLRQHLPRGTTDRLPFVEHTEGHELQVLRLNYVLDFVRSVCS